MILAIAGYMGSGKTHISKLLSQKLGFKLIDLDKEITSRTGQEISEIFRQKGELFFRKTERATLVEVLQTEQPLILSLGGGTPAYYDNMSLINQHSLSVYLQTSVPTIVQRLLRQKAKRPIIANIPDEELTEFVAKHLFERQQFYSQCRIKVSTDNQTPEVIADQIIKAAAL